MRLALMRARQPLSGGRQVLTAGQGNLLPVFSGGSAEPNGRSALRVTLETMVRGGPGFDMLGQGSRRQAKGRPSTSAPDLSVVATYPSGYCPVSPGGSSGRRLSARTRTTL